MCEELNIYELKFNELISRVYRSVLKKLNMNIACGQGTHLINVFVIRKKKILSFTEFYFNQLHMNEVKDYY